MTQVSFAAAQSSNGNHVKGDRDLEMFSFEFHLLEDAYVHNFSIVENIYHIYIYTIKQEVSCMP